MKKLLILFLLLALPCIAESRMNVGIVGGGVAAPAGCTISGCSGAKTCTGATGCVKRETFEGSTECYSGFDSSCDGAWYYATGADFTYATSPAPLQSLNSMFMDNNSAYKALIEITPASTVYAATMVTLGTTPVISNTILGLQIVADTNVCSVALYSNSHITVNQTGGTEQVTEFALSAGTPYYVMVKGVAGTGLNASCTPYISSNGSSWTTGTASTDGTWTGDITYVAIAGGTDGAEKIYDDIRISASAINYW